MKKTFIFLLITGYLFFRPFLGPATCIYPLSCGDYAFEQLKTRPLLPALWAIIKRVLSCNPFTRNLE